MTELNPELIEHAPTTGQVMDAYVHINPEDASATPAAFDRWLSDIIRQAKAEAWDEGAEVAWGRSTPEVNGARYHWRSAGEPVNPYEQGGQP